MNKGALFSDDRFYRYVLWRTWDTTLPMAMMTGLNASTADENNDDPTIRRVVSFGRAWGYGGVYMTNIFAARSTDPKALRHMDDPVGPLNDGFLVSYGMVSDVIVLAYGAHGEFLNRGEAVIKWLTEAGLASKLRHLGLTRNGHPRHPLYLPNNTLLERWND